MGKNALMTCPVCRTEMPMAMFFSCEESARTFTRLALLSIPLGARVMRYLTLFTPPKTTLTQGKQLKLIEALLPDLERRAVTVAGMDWQAPLDLWSHAFEKLFTLADDGRLTLPLSGHNYLYSTIRDLALKAAAKADQEKRNAPGRSVTPPATGSTNLNPSPPIDPALAAIHESTRNAAKPGEDIRKRIAEITGRRK